MKNVLLFFSALILGTSGILASSTVDDKVATRNAYRYDNSFIFVENGITFSVYPDGEFDFYIENQVTGRRNGITFNSGFDYSPFAQYDDYGAVIQVENVPIFYDYYGRVIQIGDVDINYNRGRVRRVGGMYVYYNRRGLYDYHTGYINPFNRYYTYRPFHSFFARPSLGFCLVFGSPYRRYYNPLRYTYYRPYRYNHRRAYATIGKTHRYNRVRQERASVYRNDKRVAVRDSRRSNAVRSNRTTSRSNRTAVARNTKQTRKNTISRRGNNVRSNGTVRGNSNSKVAGRSVANRSTANRTVTKRSSERSPRQNTVTKRTTVRSPRQGTVTKRTVTRTPKSTIVTRSKTQKRTANSTRKAPIKSRNTTARSSAPRRTVSKAPSRSRNTSARSSAPRRTVSKASSRTSRSSSARTNSGRSSRRQ